MTIVIRFLAPIEDAGCINQFESETSIAFDRDDQINQDNIHFYPLECNFDFRIFPDFYS
jgi:hypothetical protein